MKNILFLENEGVIRETIVKGITDYGITVNAFEQPNELLRYQANVKPEWLLLDMDIQDHNPYFLALSIRRKYPEIVIIFWGITSPVKAMLFELGINGTGYIKKTLDIDQFIPKLNHYLNCDAGSLWKRGEIPFNFGKSSLSISGQQLSTPSETYHLTLKETALLEMLLLHKNDVLPREKSLSLIWGRNDYYTARTMDVCVSKLKRKLAGDQSISIVNLRSVGHKLMISEN